MAYPNNQSGQRISVDRFGNEFTLQSAKQVFNKKTGEMIEGHFKGWFETGNNLFKIETSPANKEDKNGNPVQWMKITKVKKRSAANKW